MSKKKSFATASLDPYRPVATWQDETLAYLSIAEDLGDGTVHEYVGSTPLLTDKGKAKTSAQLRTDLVAACKEQVAYTKKLLAGTPKPLDIGLI
jgi:hypothetical protein